MKPDIEQRLKDIGIHLQSDTEIKKIEKIMSICSSKGLLLNNDNSLVVKKAMVQLATNRGLRAAHVFLVENDEVEWNLFFPGDEPLTQAEVNGHLMVAIEHLKYPAMYPLGTVHPSSG